MPRPEGPRRKKNPRRGDASKRARWMIITLVSVGSGDEQGVVASGGTRRKERVTAVRDRRQWRRLSLVQQNRGKPVLHELVRRFGYWPSRSRCYCVFKWECLRKVSMVKRARLEQAS